MLVNFKVFVKLLIGSPYERMIFLYKTCHGDFLVIKRQQLKPNNHDWISIDPTVVPKSFKIWFENVSEKNCTFTNGNYFLIQRVQPK